MRRTDGVTLKLHGMETFVQLMAEKHTKLEVTDWELEQFAGFMKAAESMDDATWAAHSDFEHSKKVTREYLDSMAAGKEFRRFLCFALVTELRHEKSSASWRLTTGQVQRFKEAVIAWTACCVRNRVGLSYARIMIVSSNARPRLP